MTQRQEEMVEGALIVGAFLAVLTFVGLLKREHPTPQRPYWSVTVAQLAAGAVAHTHVELRGRVDYVGHEDDGDLHVRVVDSTGAFIVAECIPALPCRRSTGVPWVPRVGDQVTLYGITRHDPEHNWWELHPVEGVGP